jgi:hypothetical protein
MPTTLAWDWEQPPDGGCVCLFAHYDADGMVAPYVRHYLAELRAAGVRVCFISAAGLPPAEVATLRGLAGAVLLRDNGGLDFGSWQAALARGLADGFGHVLLANDSVFGPLRPLAPYLQQARGFDAWGMVESRQHNWHLQSWFILLRSEVLARPAIRAVLTQPFAEMSKPQIIARGELALGRALQQERCRCGAASRALREPLLQRRRPTNRMHADWRALAASGAVPFVKVELLRDNPLRSPGVSQWPLLLRGRDYPRVFGGGPGLFNPGGDVRLSPICHTCAGK